MAPQDSQNCGRDFAKRKQTDAEFAGNSLLCMFIIDIVSNTSLGGLTPVCIVLDGTMFLVLSRSEAGALFVRGHSSNKYCVTVYGSILMRFSSFFSDGIGLSEAVHYSHFRR